MKYIFFFKNGLRDRIAILGGVNCLLENIVEDDSQESQHVRFTNRQHFFFFFFCLFVCLFVFPLFLKVSSIIVALFFLLP
jgi:hypothetical protein